MLVPDNPDLNATPITNHGSDARAAIVNALALVAPTSNGKLTSVVPTSAAQIAITRLATAGTYEAFQATKPNLKALAKQLFDWYGDPKGNATVAKAIGCALGSVNTQGNSQFNQGVEVIAYAVACVPLLDSDALARLMALSQATQTIYAPIRYPASTAQKLQVILERYPAQRREKLLGSLWKLSHTRRWWEVVGDVRTSEQANHVRNNARGRQRETQQVVAGTHPSQDVSQELAERLAAGTLTFDPGLKPYLENLVLSKTQRMDFIAHLKRPNSDPDLGVIASHLKDLRPLERAESPMTRLSEMLEQILTEDLENFEAMPEHPKQWHELYPEAILAKYPTPQKVLDAFHNVCIPGTGGPKEPPLAVCELLRTASEIAIARQFLANQPIIRYNQFERGVGVLGRIFQAGSVYSFALSGLNGKRVVLEDLVSPYQNRIVPSELHRGIEIMLASL